jgi:tRNA pseudouridine13 synthase
MPSLPFLTQDMSPIGGKIKTRPEDFYVEELPLYEASGEGTHIYFQIEKCEIPTMDAVSAIAKALGRAKSDIGCAGHKDSRAVTRQWLSVEHVKPEIVEALDVPKIRVLQVTRHKNKLKTGHLKANKFKIKLRDCIVPMAQAARIAGDAIAILEKRGVPNYYGLQRFGSRNDSHILGRFIAKGQTDEFADQFLGRPTADELPIIIEARKLYEARNFEESYKRWPWNFADQRRALKTLIETAGNKRKAYNVVDKNLKRFLVSAFQSELFNEVLAARMPDIDKILTGDMAYKHENGAMFAVTDAQAEQPRCDRFEISPTGPLLGISMRKLEADAGVIENPILERAGLNDRDLEQIDNFARGGRRPLRFKPQDCAVATGKDGLGEYLEFSFTLDPGCYATTLLREICKTEIG